MKKTAFSSALSFSLALACVCVVPPTGVSSLYAQTDAAQLSGNVTDATGAAVPGAKVTVSNNNNGLTRTVTTTAAGTYIVPGLPIGAYTVTATAAGFGTFKGGITLNVGSQASLDAKLGASTDQTVTVEAGDEASQVNVSNQETSTIITPKQIVDLPSITRDPYTFVALSAGASSDTNGSTARGVGFALNGQRAAGTEILLDGVENADNYDGTAGQSIPNDSVSEYRVITNGFDAQYGRASGGVVNLATKSGSNRFHGSAYEYNRISALAANTFAEDAQNFVNRANGLPNNPQDHFTENQFGYSIGGPILRDRLFFFNNYEWNRVRSSGQANFAIPTAAFLATTAANTQAFFAQYGKINPATRLGALIGTTGFQVATRVAPIDAGAGLPINQLFGLSRVDFNTSSKLSMYLRVGTYKQDFFPGAISLSPYTGYDTSETQFNQAYLFSATYQITPSLLSSSKISFGRQNLNEPLGTNGIVPGLFLTSNGGTLSGNPVALPGYGPTSPGNALPFGGPANDYQFVEDMSYTKGKHTLKFGGQFIQIRDNRTFGAYETAFESFATTTSVTTGLANFKAGTVGTFQVALNPQGKLPCAYNAAGVLQTTAACSITLPATSPNFERQNTFNDGNWYVEDQWKATPRLTLNAGVRWEYYGVQHNHNPNLESNFFLGTGANLAQQVQSGQVATTPNSPVGGLTKKNLKNYAPRIGFAFDPTGNGKFSIRGGYGISYERNFGNVTYNVIQNPPNYAGVVVNNTPLTNSNFGPFGAATGSVALTPPSLRALQQNMPTAYTHQYNLSVQDELAPNLLMTLTYSGARGVHQYAIANINDYGMGTFVGYANGLNTAAPSYRNDRINPQYAGINYREANGNSHYDSGNVSLSSTNYRRLGLTLTLNYTYSHALDNLSSTFSESSNNFNLGYLNAYNPRLDYGNADYDVRHRLAIGGIYQPSFLEFKSSRVAHALAGGLEFAPLATVRTGTPFTIYDCTNGYTTCPRIIPTAGLAYHGTTPNNQGFDTTPSDFQYINLPTSAANPFVNSQGISEFPDQLGGYQNQGLDRNQFFAPRNISFDMGVYKNFAFGNSERYKVQLRGEFYNILNMHNYYPIVSTADYAEVTNVGVAKGSPSGAVSSSDERRNVQLAIRLEF